MEDILARIIKLRQARGWSEYQLAVKSALPQSTISSWYRKDLVPSVQSLEKICAAFDISLSQLLPGKGRPWNSRRTSACFWNAGPPWTIISGRRC